MKKGYALLTNEIYYVMITDQDRTPQVIRSFMKAIAEHEGDIPQSIIDKGLQNTDLLKPHIQPCKISFDSMTTTRLIIGRTEPYNTGDYTDDELIFIEEATA